MEEYKKIKTVNQLSETKQDILHLINEFGKLHNSKEEFRVHFTNDQLQKTETDTCGVFQLYFFKTCSIQMKIMPKLKIKSSQKDN